MRHTKDELFKYMTYNRKLKLEEYDDNGNLIDIREFNDKDMFGFMHIQTNFCNAISVARKEDIDIFSEQELKIISDIIMNSQYHYPNERMSFYWFTNTEAEWFKNLFTRYTIEEINFALSLLDGGSGKGLLVHPKSQYFGKRFYFDEAIDFIKNRDGIYYTVDYEGKRVYDFIDKPTKKQVVYQRVKNSNRCVYLSFKDWKEYAISENELE